MGKAKIISLAALGIIALSAIYIPGYIRIRQLAQENRQLEKEIQEIALANERLSQEHQKLLHDPIYLEKVAREKLGVARKGEIVYEVVPQEEK